MPTLKATLIFQAASNTSQPNAPVRRLGGFSESYYNPTATIQSLLQIIFQGSGVSFGGLVGQPGFPGLCAARAALLPTGTSIVGVRISQVSPRGPSQSLAVTIPGSSGMISDVPQNGLLCKFPGLGVINIRRAVLRAIPDPMIVDGEYAPTPQFAAALQLFFFSLSGFQFLGRDLSQPLNPITSSFVVGGVTTFNTANNVTQAVGSFVRILKTKDASGNLRGGRFQIASILVNPPGFTVNNWTFGPTTGGNYRADATVFPTIDTGNCQPSRIVVKKVGRPPFQYRGRRSRRR